MERNRSHRNWPFPITFAAVVGAALAAGPPAAAQQIRAGVDIQYGTATSAFGLSSAAFTVPYQENASADGVLSGTVEYLLVRGFRVDVGVALRGSAAFSGWDLGSPGVTDSQGYTYYPDDVHISADWWALAAGAVLHVHLGRLVTLDGAIGYGPYGYFNVGYWDDAGVTAGPVTPGSGVFPPDAWAVDWLIGASFGIFDRIALDADVGMRGPDLVTGLGVNFPL